jgi:hypothetical protein
VLTEINGDDVDAILQVGTNLANAAVAADAERWLAKPVLSMNVVTYWDALRRCGIGTASMAAAGFSRSSRTVNGKFARHHRWCRAVGVDGCIVPHARRRAGDRAREPCRHL